MRKTIKDFYGKIIGSIDEASNGDLIAKDFYGRILGRYDKKMNVTKDFYGKILGTGDLTSSLVWNADAKEKERLRKNIK